jgi:ferrochelatase
MRRVWPKDRPLFEVCSYPDHPRYLEASAAALRDAIAKVRPENRDKLLVVFSAHGLPMSQVRKGDPYPREVEASARGTADRAGIRDWQVTFQSKVGPAKWLGPDTSEWLEANSRGRAVVTHPIAFVSEHLETLYDMDILAAEAARKGGALEYHRAAAVGTQPEFIAALADVVRMTLAAAVPSPR